MRAKVETTDRVLRHRLGLLLPYPAFLGGLSLLRASIATFGAAIVGVVTQAASTLMHDPLRGVFGPQTGREY